MDKRDPKLAILLFASALVFFQLSGSASAQACTVGCKLDNSLKCEYQTPNDLGSPVYSSCMINPQNDGTTQAWSLGNCYDTASNNYCKQNSCPTSSDSPNVANQNGAPCKVLLPCAGGGSCSADVGNGVWDASDSKCVVCSSTGENTVCGDSSGVYLGPSIGSYAGANLPCNSGYFCSKNGDKNFESACGADAACDEKAQGASCGTGKVCDANGKCAIPPSSCSATLSISSSSCAVTASVSATGCDGKTFEIKDSAGTSKCSGVIAAGSGSCAPWSISAGATYSLFVPQGSATPVDTKTASATCSDGTASGSCSTGTLGKKCVQSGGTCVLQSDPSCSTCAATNPTGDPAKPGTCTDLSGGPCDQSNGGCKNTCASSQAVNWYSCSGNYCVQSTNNPCPAGTTCSGGYCQGGGSAAGCSWWSTTFNVCSSGCPTSYPDQQFVCCQTVGYSQCNGNPGCASYNPLVNETPCCTAGGYYTCTAQQVCTPTGCQNICTGSDKNSTLYCQRCASCSDKIQNCGETSVDSGGPYCGQPCTVPVVRSYTTPGVYGNGGCSAEGLGYCKSYAPAGYYNIGCTKLVSCSSGSYGCVYQCYGTSNDFNPASCSDKVQNCGETGVDCGGKCYTGGNETDNSYQVTFDYAQPSGLTGTKFYVDAASWNCADAIDNNKNCLPDCKDPSCSSALVCSDTTPPLVSVLGAPADWSSSAPASVYCDDGGGSGCNTGSYRLATYPADPGSCPQTYSSYPLNSPLNITSRAWVCGAAKDNAGNAGFSTPKEFKIYSCANLTVQPIDFQGNKNYLNVFWNATYPPASGQLSAQCWMNCPYNATTFAGCPSSLAAFGNISSACQNYQSCTYTGIQGQSSCTFNNPAYLYSAFNNVTCMFYKPADPSILLAAYANGSASSTFYPNGAFRIINFQPIVQPGLSQGIGGKAPFKISVRNTGLFDDGYTVNITNNNPNTLQISPLLLATGNISRLEIASVSPQLTILSTAGGSFNILVTSNGSSCASNPDCSYLGAGYLCSANKCGVNIPVSVKGGFNSLPDFGPFELAILFAAATFLFSATFFNKGKTKIFNRMSKAQSEIISALLVVIIATGLVSTAYLWGVPLIQKQQDTALVDRVYDSLNPANANSPARIMQNVLNFGGEQVYTAPTDGSWALSDYTANNSLQFSFSARVSNLANNTWVSLIPGVTCGPDGLVNTSLTYYLGTDTSYAVCGTSALKAGGAYAISYKISFHDLLDQASGKTYRVQLTKAGTSTVSSFKSIKVSRGTPYVSGSTVITPLNVLLQ